MVKLPIVSGSKIIKILQKHLGFKIVGKKGSHVRLKKKTDEEIRIVVVPLHSELTPGTLRSILRRIGYKKDEFVQLLKKKK
jgi:predicted RNA binding protein YcfA (HicA-like mRNA interferase family)